MSALQISLLILALLAIGLVGFISHRRSEAPRQRKAPRLDDGEQQLDLLGDSGRQRQGGFDEYGVSEPRPRGGGAATAPAADEPAPASRRGADPGAAAGGGEKILSLFVVQPQGRPIPGAEIHRQLRALGLEPGERLTYERRVGGRVWFHVANMRKPGHLDPGEADRFETPGLSLFQLLSDVDDPVTASDDLLDTAQRLAERLDGVLLDESRQPLDADGIAVLREEVSRWASKHA